MEINSFVAKKIIELRNRHNGGLGISQSELARQLKISPNTVSRWESGEYKPKVEDLYNLGKFFSVSVVEFFPNEKVGEENQLIALLRSNSNLDEDDIREVKKFAEFRIAQKLMASNTRKKSGRKRKQNESL